MRNVATQQATCRKEVRIAQGFRQQAIIWVTLLGTCFPDAAAGEVNPLPPAENSGLVKQAPGNARHVVTERGIMVGYTETIPGTDVTLKMIPVPAGVFLLGSTEDDPHHQQDEGPQVKVEIPPFWIGSCEITWEQYHVYIKMYGAFKQLAQMQQQADLAIENPQIYDYFENLPPGVDAVTSPTPLYDPSTTYQVGKQPEQPAVTMTQFAAKQFTKWLSGITGRDYRLPTEAEWEYAARAGTTTAYSFGNNDDNLSEHAWYAENATEKTHPVGTKKPNPWGLYDMHGNVAEWVLDGYDAGHFQSLQGKLVTPWEAVNWPTQLYPRVIRGGCWFDDAELCRSSARHQSQDPDWNISDPNLPLSPWWFTEEESMGVGFRIVRPLEPMDELARKQVWEADIEMIQLDVTDRMEEGRGAQAVPTKHLPAAVDTLNQESPQ